MGIAVAWALLRRSLKQARIRQIAASNPMDRMAILRFLLALLYWCKGNPPGRQGFRSLYFLRNGSRNSMTTRIVSTFWVMARDSIRTKLPQRPPAP